MSLKGKVISILSRHGIRLRKGLSQNFLIDEKVLNREVEYAEVEMKSVLEIGPGLGFLTERLVEKAKEVWAVEKDWRMVEILLERLKEDRVRIIPADFLLWDPPMDFDVVISNVPYNISSPILFKLAEMNFQRAILCFQKEFVEKMLKRVGEKGRSRLSVMCEVLFRVKPLEEVPRAAFFPKPKVDSCIIELIRTGKVIDPFVRKIISLLFQHKRKTVRNALADSAKALGMDKKDLKTKGWEIRNAEKRVIDLSIKELEEVASDLRDFKEVSGG